MTFIKAFIAFCIAAGFISHTPDVLLTVYDPDMGGINCDEDCNTLADGHKWTDSDYGTVAACPSWLLFTGRTKIGIDVSGLELVCRDTGSMVDIRWNDTYESYVIHIDVMYDINSLGYPEWNYLLVDLKDVDFYFTEVE